MRLGRPIILAALLLAVFAQTRAAGKARFASSRLERLAADVRLPMPEFAGDTCCVVGTFRGYPVLAGFCGGTVVHLGIDLFGAEYKAASNALLCDFTERYLLELLAEEDEQARMRRMYDDGVAVMGDLRRIPLLKREPLRFDVTSVPGKGCRMEWRDGNAVRFSISAPAQYELLRGMNKIELEESFRPAVLTYYGPAGLSGTSDPSGPTGPSDLPADMSGPTARDDEPVRLDSGLYVFRKGHYLLEQMECASYYTLRDGRYMAVCDTLHPVESLRNLFSGKVPDRDYTLDLTLRKYGFRTEEFSCPLGRVVDFCLAQGCTPYVGVESEEDGVITAVLIMVNAEYGYNHLFKIIFDTRLLGQGQGHVAATLNAYTPTHNLENLYDEERQTRHRGAPKIKL